MTSPMADSLTITIERGAFITSDGQSNWRGFSRESNLKTLCQDSFSAPHIPQVKSVHVELFRDKFVFWLKGETWEV